MKKHILILIVILSFVQNVFGNDSIKSKVIFYREANQYGYALLYKLYVGDSLLTKLKNNSCYTYNCIPGEYNFSIDKNKNSKLLLNITQGKTYYVRFGLKIGFWSATPELILVDSVSAYPIISNSTLRHLDKPYLPIFKFKNRLGLNLNSGGGFEKTTMVITSNGEESSISFGGGFAFGLKYGYEFNKHFDLSVDLNHQFSELNPYLKNCNVTFNRNYLSITPSYILSINDGEYMRFKFGIGLDNYFSSTLKIETSKIVGGFNDEWIYNNSIGYHIQAIFEINTSEKWTVDYGLKYYNVNYLFDKANNSIPLNKLVNPNGSGLDLLLGIYYHF